VAVAVAVAEWVCPRPRSAPKTIEKTNRRQPAHL
jgi:hypothetical protein